MVFCRSVFLSVMIVNPAKMTVPIQMLFGKWNQVGPKHVLDGLHIGASVVIHHLWH